MTMPIGIPNMAKKISHFALLNWMWLWSWITTTKATKIDINTERGTAISSGINRMNSGTATKDSPKPKVERTKVAKKLIMKI